MKRFILSFILLIITVYTFATSIEVSDTLKTNTQWSGIDTVKLVGDLTINKLVTLTIDPGIVVEAQGMFYISVLGNLKAIGTASDSIKLTALDKETGWNRFLLSNLSIEDTSLFKYCIFEYEKPVNNSETNKSGAIFYIRNNLSKIDIDRYATGLENTDFIITNSSADSLHTITDGTDYLLTISNLEYGSTLLIEFPAGSVKDQKGITNTSTSISYDIPTASTLALFEERSSINLFPNPTTGHFYLQFNKTYNEIDLLVCNLNVTTIANKRFYNTNQLEYAVDGHKGIYFLKITTGDNILYKKLIKN
jgi:hypothetical protein